jgi:hypothetical protein
LGTSPKQSVKVALYLVRISRGVVDGVQLDAAVSLVPLQVAEQIALSQSAGSY